MLQLPTASLPSQTMDYFRNLSRSGMDLSEWRTNEYDVPVSKSSISLTSPIYNSWSDGQIGIFGTFTDSNSFLLDARITCDTLAFGIDLDEVSRTFQLSGHWLMDMAKNVKILSFPKGSQLRISSNSGGMRTVVLMVKVEDLLRVCEMPLLEFPATIRNLIEGHSPMMMRCPIAVERIAEDVLNMTGDQQFASLFYKSKSAELLRLILEHLRCEEELPNRDVKISERDCLGIERVRCLIEEQATRNWTTDELGRIAAMNRTKLRLQFKQLYGMTMFDYRTSIIMQRADKMLKETALSIAEIGFRLGYSEASSFTTAYKRFYGHAPGRLRRQH